MTGMMRVKNVTITYISPDLSHYRVDVIICSCIVFTVSRIIIATNRSELHVYLSQAAYYNFSDIPMI